MFWRSDPSRQIKLESNAHWPRDGATLKGEVVTHNGKKWLATTHVKQAKGEYKEAPYGAYIPFEYDNDTWRRQFKSRDTTIETIF